VGFNDPGVRDFNRAFNLPENERDTCRVQTLSTRKAKPATMDALIFIWGVYPVCGFGHL
jgi:hypothetical protein